MRPGASFLAALAAAVVGCQSMRAAEPAPRVVDQAIYRPAMLPAVNHAVYVKPAAEREVPVQLVGGSAAAEAPVQLVADRQPARFPLARGVVDCFRLRCPNPCPRICPPTPVSEPEDKPPAKEPPVAEAAEPKKPDGTGLLCATVFSLAAAASVIGRASAGLFR
ncbi:MAG TPA: hypothetical protein VG826_29150 [Pirellulales bacterium]|nr:hypothetical protein [Pirellulales bacterium]